LGAVVVAESPGAAEIVPLADSLERFAGLVSGADVVLADAGVAAADVGAGDT
jgi:hypothetical protein